MDSASAGQMVPGCIRNKAVQAMASHEEQTIRQHSSAISASFLALSHCLGFLKGFFSCSVGLKITEVFMALMYPED